MWKKCDQESLRLKFPEVAPMDNDRLMCAGTKLEAGKQLSPAAAAFLPAVSSEHFYIHIVNLSRFTHDSLHWKSRLGGTFCNLTTKLSKERIVFYPNYVVSIFVQCASLCELDCQRNFVIFHLLMHFLFFLLLLSSVVWVLTDK